MRSVFVAIDTFFPSIGVALGLALLPSFAPQSAAQTRPADGPALDSGRSVAFEAASVKPNKSAGAGSSVGRQPGGRLGAQNAPLREIIEFAYQIQSFQLVDGAPWVDVDRWDIAAKLETVPAPTTPGTPDDAILALRTLLADRFKLVVRRETRPLPIYALVPARSDGRLGPQITRSTLDCMALMAAVSRGTTPPPGSTPASGGGPQCGLRGRIGSIQSGGVPLSEFAVALSSRVQRPVVDRTGLTGPWDFTLTYTPEPSQIPQGVLTPGTPPPSGDPNGASLFTAIQEQLGLKLESTRGPIEVLVIEHVERPTAN